MNSSGLVQITLNLPELLKIISPFSLCKYKRLNKGNNHSSYTKRTRIKKRGVSLRTNLRLETTSPPCRADFTDGNARGPAAALQWKMALCARTHPGLWKMSSSVSGVSWMLSFTGDRGSGFLQEGSFSESLQNRTECHECGVFQGQRFLENALLDKRMARREDKAL